MLLNFDAKSFFFFYCGMRGLNKWKIHIGLMNINRNWRDTMVFCVCSELNRVSTTFTSVSGCFFCSFEKPINVDISLLVNARINSEESMENHRSKRFREFFFNNPHFAIPQGIMHLSNASKTLNFFSFSSAWQDVIMLRTTNKIYIQVYWMGDTHRDKV